MKCIFCEHEIAANSATCPQCSYPIAGDSETQRQFLYRKLVGLKSEADDSLELVSKAKYVMYTVAVLTAISALRLILGANGDPVWISIGIVYALIAGTLAFLGVRVEKNPTFNISIGFVLTFLSIGGGLIGWISLLAMTFCLYSVTVYRRSQKQVIAIQTKMEQLH
ncbi:hypothetical protein [Alistipes sp.]|uniref:hypothetical protein n=1 Tax=Alistipes sp. TaxID=1872444 RepID=UPI003AB2ED7A